MKQCNYKDIMSAVMLSAHNVGAGGTIEFYPASAAMPQCNGGMNKRWWQRRHRISRAYGSQRDDMLLSGTRKLEEL